MAWVNRVRRRVRLLALLVTAIGMLAVATAGLLVERGQGPPSRLSLNCLPYAQPDDVDGVNELIGEYRGIPGFVGAELP